MVARVAYPLDQSPFYRLSSKLKLANLLGFNLKNFSEIIAESNYHVFLNKQKRTIQHPIGQLAPIHKRIAKLLSRIDLPEYLHSRKRRSYVSNAAAHATDVPLIKTDIAKFYPSTSFSAVFMLFQDRFKCSRDVSWHLAQICCYKGRHLPTGSYLSGIVAFLANQLMFEEIHALALKNRCTMTCYVDDIVLSGAKATKGLLYEVSKIIRRHGLVAKPDKSKTFPAEKPKIVTGVVITSQGLRVPNRRLREIRSAGERLKQAVDPREREQLLATLRGRLQEAKQIHGFSSAEKDTFGDKKQG